ncbi:uncharacterized protein LOC131010346 [Salvia miltiorrhiza]|uniref:uncharacterized protein LOC131010346 n=1 Tax=Salvia miltiorrhiza TaxID=226208 RepID=UPI0025AD6A31|nr:uncharacterized protein LOC131010346 [Salvia miltiorrhiza]
MERDCKRKKTKKKRESFEERSPLQHLNGLPIHRRNTKRSSHISSSSSAPAASRSLLSDNNTSSSRTHIHKNRPNRFPKIAKHESNVHTSNETPRKPFLQTKPTCKNRQRSKLSFVEDKSEKGSGEFQKNMNNSDGNLSGKCTFNGSSSNCAEICTPYSINFCDHESAIDESVCAANDVKTPPVEASLSPEIQPQSQSRMLVLESVGTPVCYGAGHLVSGVSDRRKSKRRGSLKGIPFSDAKRDDNDNVSVDLQESWIPLLAEASVRWHLSPCDLGNRLDQDRMVFDDGDDSVMVDSLSLPSMLCGNTLDFLCGESSYSGSGRVGNVAIDRRNTDAIFLPSILEPLRYNMDEYLGSLSSGNIIHTPDSDSCFRRSIWPGLDSITKALEGVKLSPTSEVSMWDAPGLGSHSVDIGPPPVSLDPENVYSVSSWMSDATNDNNLTLSRMRISWCEGLAGEIVGTDEFDCCCCLSDEEIEFGGEQLTKAAEEIEFGCRMVAASVEHKDDGNELSPVILDYEPYLTAEGKGKSFLLGTDACAESICTDGGGLLASDDSDSSFIQKNRLFHVT